MRTLLSLAALATLGFSACSTYEKKDLYGSWKNSTWEFSFNEDGSCLYGSGAGGTAQACTYRTTGNSMEINGQPGFQLTNLTVKGIKNDTLRLEMRLLGTPKEEVLVRVKK